MPHTLSRPEYPEGIDHSGYSGFQVFRVLGSQGIQDLRVFRYSGSQGIQDLRVFRASRKVVKYLLERLLAFFAFAMLAQYALGYLFRMFSLQGSGHSGFRVFRASGCSGFRAFRAQGIQGFRVRSFNRFQ